MKKIFAVSALLLLAMMSTHAQPRAEATPETFNESLGQYGDWVSTEGGASAWSPRSVGPGWRPYTVGSWEWTDDGWYWASEEPWAWAVYHYGRWYYDDARGWLWIPGYDWAPAWVDWRYGGDVVGWAPLGPYALYRPGFGIHYSRYWVTPFHYWSFVDCRYITDRDLPRHLYRVQDNTRFIGRTRSAGSVRDVGGRAMTSGPERGYIERRGGVRVERSGIGQMNTRERPSIHRLERPNAERPGAQMRQQMQTRPQDHNRPAGRSEGRSGGERRGETRR